MNSETPQTPREETEAKLTALLFGELPPQEAELLEGAIAQDPELATLYQRLMLTTDLLRQTVADPAGPLESHPASLKLTEERRQMLLQHFKTVALPQFSFSPKPKPHWAVPMSIAAILVLSVGLALFWDNLGPRHPYSVTPLPQANVSRPPETLSIHSLSEKASPELKDRESLFSALPATSPGQPAIYGVGGIVQGPAIAGGSVVVNRTPSPNGVGSDNGEATTIVLPSPPVAEFADAGNLSAGKEHSLQPNHPAVDASRVARKDAASGKAATFAPDGKAVGVEELATVRARSERETFMWGDGLARSEAKADQLPSAGGGSGIVELAKKPADAPVEDTAVGRLAVTAAKQTANVQVQSGPSAAFNNPEFQKSNAVEARDYDNDGILSLQPQQQLGLPVPFPTPTPSVSLDATRVSRAGDEPILGKLFQPKSETSYSYNLTFTPQVTNGNEESLAGFPSTNTTIAGSAEPTQKSQSNFTTPLPTQTTVERSSEILGEAGEKVRQWSAGTGLSISQIAPGQNQLDDLKRKANARVEAVPSIRELQSVDKSVSQAKESDLPLQSKSDSAPEPQPEVSTREHTFSTFSLNVSDVSFRLAAASLEKGVMPDPATIRSEEFINAFDYRDPEPPPGMPVAFAWERARYPFAQNRDLLRFSLKPASSGRQPGRLLNLVLLLDNSGSMERADRVNIIREALKVLAAQLQPQDKLSIVTFARTARLFVDGVSGNQVGQAIEEVSKLTPEGGTNLEEAMNLAYQTALHHYLANGVNRVVLLTDGAANLGEVEPETLKQKVEANRKQGIALDCFGIGWEGYNDNLLEVLSRNGDGRYGFINSPAEAASEFAGQLAGALRVAASDVKVQVEFNPARVNCYRQVGYARHQISKEQFRDNNVDAAEIGAAESGNALYLAEINPAGSGPLATVRIRYKIPGTTEYREHEWVIPYTGNAVALEQASPALRLAATASAFSEWLASNPYAAEVTPDRLLGYLAGVPEIYGSNSRPKKLEWMLRQAKSITGK
jgi:Mg-chelatase subunit ChlD